MTIFEWILQSRRRVPTEPKVSSCSLGVESLEDRTVPIATQLGGQLKLLSGAKFDSSLLFNGYNPDSVVKFIDDDDVAFGTGSLIATKIGIGSAAILTAAHVNQDKNNNRVEFELRRGIGIPVSIIFGGLPEYDHSSFDAKIKIPQLHDLSVSPLIDELARHYVAPFGPPVLSYYNATNPAPDPVGRAFTFFGYGYSGSGMLGTDKNSGGYRQGGENEIDTNDNFIMQYDFDDGTDAMNTFKGGSPGLTPLPLPGQKEQPLKSTDRLHLSGDSGGPSFFGREGPNGLNGDGRIFGIIRSGIGDKFGAIGRITRVDTSIGDKNVQEGLGFKAENDVLPYKLVLDMRKQVLGADTITEDFTIVAERKNGNLTLSVQGSKAGLKNGVTYDDYNGLYYSAPAKYIQSLAIIGSDDRETFIINGELWNAAERAVPVPREIVIDGGSQVSKFIINTSTSNPTDGVIFSVEGQRGAGNSLEVFGGGNFKMLSDPFFFGEEVLGINHGKIRAQGLQSTSLHGGSGDDIVTLGVWNGTISLDGGGGTDTLIATGDTNFRLIGNKVEFGINLAYQFKNFERAELTGGAGNNKFSINPSWKGLTAIKGEGGNGDLVEFLGGSGSLNLDGVEIFKVQGGEATLLNDISLVQFVVHDGTFQTNRTVDTSSGQWDGGRMVGLGASIQARVRVNEGGTFKVAGRHLRMDNAMIVNAGDLIFSSGTLCSLYGSVINNLGTLCLDGSLSFFGEEANNNKSTLYNRVEGKIINSGVNRVGCSCLSLRQHWPTLGVDLSGV